MKLDCLVKILTTPDHDAPNLSGEQEVVFNTASDHNLTAVSVYEVDGVINVDLEKVE